MTSMTRTGLVFPAFLVLASPAAAEPMQIDPGPQSSATLQIQRVARPPSIDDFLANDTEGWPRAVTDFRQRQPGDGALISQGTIAYVSYDDERLYVVFVCEDAAKGLRTHLTPRESIDGDDRVAIYLDTFHDGQRAYVFATNPLGVQQDAVLTEGQGQDRSFDTVWYSDGRLTRDGYIVRIAIPFKSLRFVRASRQTWGIALSRSIARTNEVAYWPYITRRVQGFVVQMATLAGLDDVSPGRNVQLIPYGAFTGARLLDPGVPNHVERSEARSGIDAKVVARDAFTVDLTVNPDFGQVESDDPQVTINQRFEVFFPEKRPFFIENAGFFRTPVNLLFTRRIANPQLGARLTGRSGRWVMGMLAVDDRAPGQRVQRDDPLWNRRAVIGAARVRREFGKQSHFGFMATERRFGAAVNDILAFDARLQLNPNWSATGQIIRSGTREVDGRGRTGAGMVGELTRGGRHLTYLARYADFTPGFRAPLGFVRRLDVRELTQYIGYFRQPARSSVINVGPAISVVANWDHRGRLQDSSVHSSFALDFRGPSGVRVGRLETYELYLERAYRYGRTDVSLYTEWLRWLSVFGSYAWGSAINYAHAAPLDPFLGRAADASLGFTLRPTSQLRMDQTYYRSTLVAPSSVARGSSDRMAFSNELLRSKINYQVTRELSARLILDYVATHANESLAAAQPFKRLSLDVLLGYQVNPGTAFYLGYADRFEDLAIDEAVPSVLRRTSSPVMSTARQLFLKLSYLYRF